MAHPYQKQPIKSDGHNTPGNPDNKAGSNAPSEAAGRRAMESVHKQAKSTSSREHHAAKQPFRSDGTNFGY
jgi:hypothetical protein